MQSTKSSLAFVALVLAQAAAADQYGPKNCVSVERSTDTGSCVLKTSCTGVDTSKFEFMFTCGNLDGTTTKHSFGVGGFEDVESYDTEVKCLSCRAPEPPSTAVFAAAKSSASGPTKEEKFRVASFGPDNCVSTYLSEKGTCILKTDCKEKTLDGFVFGLVCADSQGEMVRHVFGQDSYEDKESFDTLIPCAQCLGLDNFDSGKDTEEAVLKDEVEGLKNDLNEMNQRVTKLEDAAKPAAEGATTFLAHKRHHHDEETQTHVRHVEKNTHHAAVAKKTSETKKRAAKKTRAQKKREEEEDEEEDEQDDESDDQDEGSDEQEKDDDVDPDRV